jgi:hypothetical protein
MILKNDEQTKELVFEARIIKINLLRDLALVKTGMSISLLQELKFQLFGCPVTQAAISGSLSPRHDAFSGCGWRSGLQYVG